MSEKFQNKYRIASSRLQNWDYGWNGAYFITICTKNREYFFGEIVTDVVDTRQYLVSTPIGQLAEKYWLEIPNHFPFVELGVFVVMPNHVHGILIVNKKNNDDGVVDTRHCLVSTDTINTNGITTKTIGQQRFQNQGKNTISSIIGSYKSIVSKNAHKINANFAWQSLFYDHIIRNSQSFERIQNYIVNNPLNWDGDKFHK